MELINLKESVRVAMCKSNMPVLNMLATGHNIIRCIEDKRWESLEKKLHEFKISYNTLIESLNDDDTEPSSTPLKNE